MKKVNNKKISKKSGKCVKKTKKSYKTKAKIGKGIINSVIDYMPFEAHIPGFQFCGPGDYKVLHYEKIDLF